MNDDQRGLFPNGETPKIYQYDNIKKDFRYQSILGGWGESFVIEQIYKAALSHEIDFRAYLAGGDGTREDVLWRTPKQILSVQVKTVSEPRAGGSGIDKRYSADFRCYPGEYDICVLVAKDIGVAAYINGIDVGDYRKNGNVSLGKLNDLSPKYNWQNSRGNIDEFPLSKIVNFIEMNNGFFETKAYRSLQEDHRSSSNKDQQL